MVKHASLFAVAVLSDVRCNSHTFERCSDNERLGYVRSVLSDRSRWRTDLPSILKMSVVPSETLRCLKPIVPRARSFRSAYC